MPAQPNSLQRRLNNNHGQTLIIALSVMFIMVFMGTIFVILVARNLENAFRSSDQLSTRQLAEAGIAHADKMLTYSEEGADWRPAPDNLDPLANGNHPDIQWIRPYSPTEDPTTGAGPTGGFTSFQQGNGRFLLRISYDPEPRDPMSKYIKIEAIGRVGFVDSNFLGSGTPDPTTYANSGPIRLRQELTAFKPIGITDYARFVTNKEKRSEFVTFGRTLGARPLQFGGEIGGDVRTAPIRVNGNLRWTGNVELYLRQETAIIDDTGAVGPTPRDRVEVAGEILHDANASVNVLRVTSPLGSNSATVGTPETVLPSDAAGLGFTTLGGLYRDGSDIPEALQSGNPNYAGNARTVKRLEPPLVDAEDPSTGTARYRRLTLNSGVSARLGSRWANTGAYGHGRGIYINNSRDTQSEGSSIFGGGRTLRQEWTKPDGRGNWKGSFYVPPGVVIRLNPDATMTITRTDTVSRGQKYVWHSYDSVNNRLQSEPGFGATITLPYPENGVVFAEGNIRISGIIDDNRSVPEDQKRRQLTIVSNENIYIDGNIIKGDQELCAVSLLARKNVVVNSTQFFNLPPLASPIWESVNGGGQPPFARRITNSPDSNYLSQMSFGYWYDAQNPGDPLKTADQYGGIRMFLRHAASGNSAAINLFINNEAYVFGSPPVSSPVYLMSDAATQFAPTYEGAVFPMAFGNSGPTFESAPGVLNSVVIGLNQTDILQSRGDYMLQSMAIQPLDINIQALCYAQEGSFFIIPGPWFNQNPEDTRLNAENGNPRPAGTNPAYPFYGEPLDVKITIDGAVAENLPAAEGEVELWMRHWSNIPDTYGSTNEDTIHAGDGVTFLYDQRFGYPVYFVAATRRYIRQDQYGRPLPITPRLPVSSDLIYTGRLSS